MQLKKINQDHYVVVTDEPIEVGDIVLETYVDGTLGLEQIDTLNDIHPLLHKKITHSTDINNNASYYIDLFYIKSLVGEVDVEKKAEDWFDSKGHNIYNHYNTMPSFIEGYLQAIDDNKDKRFSEEDMRKAIEMSKDIKYITYSDDDIISSLTQPKDTWEVEFDLNNNLKLK